MAKYTQILAKQIAQEFTDPCVTIDSVCKKYNITKKTYYYWINNKVHFSNALKNAREKHIEKIGVLAESALAQGLKGCYYNETTTEVKEVLSKDGKIIKLTSTKTIKKFIPPNSTLIVWATKNAMPNVYMDKKESEPGEYQNEDVLDKEMGALLNELGYTKKDSTVKDSEI